MICASPTVSKYVHNRCRCDGCTLRNSQRQNRMRASRRRRSGASIACLICGDVFPTVRGRDTHEGLMHK